MLYFLSPSISSTNRYPLRVRRVRLETDAQAADFPKVGKTLSHVVQTKKGTQRARILGGEYSLASPEKPNRAAFRASDNNQTDSAKNWVP
jgi:hypothetical protein